MKISIIGSGNMATGISTRLTAANHSVVIIDRDFAKAQELANKIGENAKALTLSDANLEDIIILAVPYAASQEVIKSLGDKLEGKTLIDISNPLNATYDGLVTPVDSSAAEELAKLLPSDAKLVKAFNTVFGGTLLAGKVADQTLDVFVASDDDGVKKTVMDLVTSSNMRAIDAGALNRARQLEAMALLGITLQGTLQTGFMSAWKIIS